MDDPIKKVKLSSGEGLPRLPNGLPIPATLPPVRPDTEEEQQSATSKKDVTRRKAAGQTWVDPTLADWPDDDFRVFVGNLAPEVSDEALSAAFRKFSSFLRARVVRDSKSGRSKGYGFVSFGTPEDYARAVREMNGKYIASRPITLSRSKWQKRAA